MKKLKRSLILGLFVSLYFSITVYAEGMLSSGGTDGGQAWAYIQQDGTYLKNQWKQVWGYWYYFGEDGQSKHNTWAEINGKWYYFNEFSIMLADTTTPDGYYVGSDGAWATKTENSIDTSMWLGSYFADDGQSIIVRSVNSGSINITFGGYGEEGWYSQNYVLTLINSDKTQAVYEDQWGKTVYTLNGNQIEVSVEPSGGWKQGTYVKQ